MICETDETSHAGFPGDPCTAYNLSIDDIMALPEINIRVAFHFEAQEDGDNFVADANHPLAQQNHRLHGPVFMYYVMNERNKRYREGLVNYAPSTDLRINFEYVNGSAESSAYYYDYEEPINYLPDALNIVMESRQEFVNGQIAYPWAHRGRAELLGAGNRMWIYNAQTIYLNGGTNTWDVARNISHEFGHLANLTHAFFSGNPCRGDADGFTASSSCNSAPIHQCRSFSVPHLTMNYGIPQLSFTVCEAERMWNNLLTTARAFQDFDACEPGSGTPIVYDEPGTQIWTGRKILAEDVTIASGTTIDARCLVEIGPGKRIVVENGGKLIIDQGQFTNLCPGQYWQGIRVVGTGQYSPSSFDVMVTNGAVIENTLGSNVSMDPPVPYSQKAGLGNGVIYADNATFRNGFRAVELISHSKRNNQSYLRNCTVDNMRHGLTNWNGNGVEISNTVFTNIDRTCITTSGGAFVLEGNEFASGEDNVLFSNSSGAEASTIINNSFQGPENGITMMGATVQETEISRNDFSNADRNIELLGHSKYLVHDNDLGFGNSSYGLLVDAAGPASNHFSMNRTESLVGVFYAGSNTASRFFHNCFDNQYADADLSNADVANEIGAPLSNGSLEAADNCFSHGGNGPTHGDVVGSFSPTTYLIENPGAEDCEDVITGLPNPNLTIAQANGGYDCGGKSFNGKNDKSEDRNSQVLSEGSASIKWAIIQEINELISRAQFPVAEKLISTTIPLDQDLADYLVVQRINIRRLRSQDRTTISARDLATLKPLTENGLPSSGYAKALWYEVTGEVLHFRVDPERYRGGTKNSNKGVNTGLARPIVAAVSTGVSVAPNPFTGTLRLVNLPKFGMLTVRDALGKIAHQRTITSGGALTIPAQSWRSGVYYLSIESDGQEPVVQKIIKQ